MTNKPAKEPLDYINWKPELYTERINVCVNFCAGFSNEELRDYGSLKAHSDVMKRECKNMMEAVEFLESYLPTITSPGEGDG